eukprot:725114-Amphidinium_carterae.1
MGHLPRFAANGGTISNNNVGVDRQAAGAGRSFWKSSCGECSVGPCKRIPSAAEAKEPLARGVFQPDLGVDDRIISMDTSVLLGSLLPRRSSRANPELSDMPSVKARRRPNKKVGRYQPLSLGPASLFEISEVVANDFGDSNRSALVSAGITCTPTFQGLLHCGFNYGHRSCQEQLSSRSVRGELFRVCAFCTDAHPKQLKRSLPPAATALDAGKGRKRLRSPHSKVPDGGDPFRLRTS